MLRATQYPIENLIYLHIALRIPIKTWKIWVNLECSRARVFFLISMPLPALFGLSQPYLCPPNLIVPYWAPFHLLEPLTTLLMPCWPLLCPFQPFWPLLTQSCHFGGLATLCPSLPLSTPSVPYCGVAQSSMMSQTCDILWHIINVETLQFHKFFTVLLHFFW